MATADDITRNPDGSVTEMTFAATGVATEPSIGQKNAGLTAVPPENMFNWPLNALMDWVRAMFHRYVDGSRLLMSSWMSRNGTWSSTGVAALEGFLSDATGVPSQVADAWINPPSIDTGAVQMQVTVAKASPHLFTALKDTYVAVPVVTTIAGQVSEPELTFIEVANGNPAPATPAGTVLVWMVRTDGATITGATILLPPFPVFKQVGIEIVSAGEMMVQGDVDIGGNTEIVGTLDVDGNVVLGLTVANVHTFHGSCAIGDDVTNTQVLHGSCTIGDDETNVQIFHGNVTIGTDGTNIHPVNGDMTGTGTRTSGAITAPSIENTGATAVAFGGGATIAANKTVIGDGTTILTMGNIFAVDKVVAANGVEGGGGGGAPVALPQGASVPTAKNIALAGTSSVVGTNQSGVTVGRVEYLAGGAPPSAAGMAVGADGQPFFGPSSRMHHSPNGYVFATGDKESNSGMFATLLQAETSVAVTGISAGLVRVTYVGRIQASSIGIQLVVSLQEDQTASPAWTDIGTTDTIKSTHDNADPDSWQSVGLERIFTAGTVTPTKYRLKINPAGGATVQAKEVRLRVFSEKG